MKGFLSVSRITREMEFGDTKILGKLRRLGVSRICRQTIKTECLDRFIAFGQDHLNYLVREFVEHCNEARPHSNRNH